MERDNGIVIHSSIVILSGDT